MKSAYLQFLKRILVFSVAFAIVVIPVFLYLPGKYVTSSWPFLIPFFLSVTLIVHYILLKSHSKRPARFVASFMATVFIKLLFYLVVMVAYVFLFKEDAVRFMITYFIFYVCFMIFEVLELTRYSRRIQEAENSKLNE